MSEQLHASNTTARYKVLRAFILHQVHQQCVSYRAYVTK